MKKALLLLLIIPGLFITGCKLDAPDFSKTGKGTDAGTGTNTGTGTTNNSDSYQPVTKNTYWKYSGVVAGNTVTQTQTVTGDTATFNNKTYYAVKVESTATGNDISYYYHGNNDYTMRSTSAGFTVEYLYLKDNYEIGKTWTAPMTDDSTLNSVPAQIIGKIVEQGLAKTISGKKFINVVHTQLLVQYDLGNGFETVQTLDYYIAKGIGIVEADSSSPSGVSSTSLITDYSIK